MQGVIVTDSGPIMGTFHEAETGDYFSDTGQRGRPSLILREDIVSVHTMSQAIARGIVENIG